MDKIIDDEVIKPIEIIPGAPVEGENFFGRIKELEILKDALLKPGVSVLIPGPRRWGKSSYVRECMRRYESELTAIYIDLHRVHSLKEFYDLIMKQKENSSIEFFSRKAENLFKNVFNRASEIITTVSISEAEISIGKIADKSNHAMMEDLMGILIKLRDKKIILILDEISDFVMDIQNKSSKDEAVEFLRWLRTLRNHQKVQMVITGSISIKSVLRELQVQDLVNDMKEIELKPLNTLESQLFFKCLLKSREIVIKGEALTFCEGKLIKEAHYFIQLFADCVVENCYAGETIEKADAISEIYNKLISKSSATLEDYHSRLKEHFNPTDCACAKIILAHLYDSILDFEDIYAFTGDIFKGKQRLLDLLVRLEEEGYIINSNDKYTFISRILADYWYKHFRYDKGDDICV
ncbi:ATP-binding protein (plasmid) [Clostridium estertheticum]|uniref:ATP-binding protein n=1 Tax=Clostridium estertheticum TaxID=238834 RepID=UPI001C0B5398|nr:ATP-binding protein [Clostridium estertheticum]MBU3202319.1 ATP-binding protein [Clostridium estertheticum]WAG68152.1 ATP-binding protein [Clostridium estertheticum]